MAPMSPFDEPVEEPTCERSAHDERPAALSNAHLVGLIVQRTKLEDDAPREALAVIRDEIPSDVVV